MIEKWYEVSCDICGWKLIQYAMFQPTPTELRRNGIKVKIYNGKIHTYCDECYEKIRKGGKR